MIYYLLSVATVCLVLSFPMGLSLGSAYWNPTAKGALKSGTLSIVNLKDRPALTGQIIRSGDVPVAVELGGQALPTLSR